MILSDKDIIREIENKSIVISPYDPACLGSNSYDVHLSKYLAVYKQKLPYDILDAKKHNEIEHFEIDSEVGYVIQPGTLYLGTTLEYTETHKHVPFLEGKSSTGRLGINIHATAGKGDIGFCNHWTLEISCIHPVRIYAGMPIAQLIYFEANAAINPYNTKKGAKYTERNECPKESMMFKNQF